MYPAEIELYVDTGRNGKITMDSMGKAEIEIVFVKN